MEFNKLENGFLSKKIEIVEFLLLDAVNKYIMKEISVKESNKKQLPLAKDKFEKNAHNDGKYLVNKDLNRLLNINMEESSKNLNNGSFTINSHGLLKNQSSLLYVKEEDDENNFCYYTNKIHNMDISTGHLILSYMEKYKDDPKLLCTEWEEIAAYNADDTSISSAMMSCNQQKNRSLYSIPYDKNRVHLSKENNLKNSDYINASYIVNDNPRKTAYIFTQNPTPSTMVDFWQMVWESGSNVIVNLTSLSDQSHPYWPEYDSCLHHNFKLHLISQHITHSDFIIRNLLINKKESKNNGNIKKSFPPNADTDRDTFIEAKHEVFPNDPKAQSCNKFTEKIVKEYDTNNNGITEKVKEKYEDNSRLLTIFHYFKWPSRSIPANPSSLLAFIKKVNKQGGKKNPIIIHCNDGSDRTGVYAVIDNVIKRIISGVREINIAGTVEHFQDQRMGIIENKRQYEFCVETIATYIRNSLLKPCPCNK